MRQSNLIRELKSYIYYIYAYYILKKNNNTSFNLNKNKYYIIINYI